MADTTYNDESIKALKGADRVRMRPGVMLGSDDLKGAFHTFKEILGNSLDEARAGFGNTVKVVKYKDGSISVEDNGRGVPMAWNEAEQRYNWQLVFDELYAGGKYDDSEYKFSVGLNGLGSTATQYTSEYMIVVSKRDGKKYTMNFKQGKPVGELQTEDLSDEEKAVTGTFIKWKPDIDVFTEVDIPFKMITEYCTGQAHINSVTIIMENERHPNKNVTVVGQGIKYCLTEKLGDKVIDCFDNTNATEEYRTISGQTAKGQEYSAKIDFVLAITEECNTKQFYFHNTAEVKGGQHDMAFRNVLAQFFKELGKQAGMTVQPSDYNDYISVIISTYSNITSFANQVKDSVSNDFIYTLVEKALADKLNELVEKENPVIKDMISKVFIRVQARKAAKEAEMLARKAKKVTANRRSEPEKFVACSEKNPAKRELYIVEGDSALGSCKDARDSGFQALIPIRGKILNCLKAPMASILENDIIGDLVQTIGCGIDTGDALESGELFNIEKLKYNKIIICTDADVDGYQIRVLLYTMFYRLMPKLIEEGYVYIAETPLFELETNKGSKFAYTVAEKDELLKECEKEGIKVYKVNRSKGLGENTPEMMSLTTMAPETRRLTQIKFNPFDALVVDITNMLFGTDPTDSRKEFLISILGNEASDLKETIDVIEEVEEESDPIAV